MSVRTEWRLGLAGIGLCILATTFNAIQHFGWMGILMMLCLSIVPLITTASWSAQARDWRAMDAYGWDALYFGTQLMEERHNAYTNHCFWQMRMELSLLLSMTAAFDWVLVIMALKGKHAWLSAAVLFSIIAYLVSAVKCSSWMKRFSTLQENCRKAFGSPMEGGK